MKIALLRTTIAMAIGIANFCPTVAPPAIGQQPPSAGAGDAAPGPIDIIEVPVYLEPYRSIEISSVESGEISEILVKEGQKVQAGQELIKLDLEVLEAQMAVAKAQAEGRGRIMSAEAEYALQADKLSKLKALRGGGRANEAEIDRVKASTKSAEGVLLSAQEEVKVFELSALRIQAEIQRRILRSPIDGEVVEIVKDVAEPVSVMRGQQGEPDYLIRVVQLDLLKTIAHLPSVSARKLKEGDVLKLSTESSSGEEITVSGTVEFVSPINQPSTNTVSVRLRIENADRKLRGGTAARVLMRRE